MAVEKPRYSRLSDIIDLATFMSSKIQGVTITEIAERYKAEVNKLTESVEVEVIL